MEDNIVVLRSVLKKNCDSDDEAIMNQVVVTLTEEGWPLREALLMVRQVSQIFEGNNQAGF